MAFLLADLERSCTSGIDLLSPWCDMDKIRDASMEAYTSNLLTDGSNMHDRHSVTLDNA
jgi:hypothetical protein